jgi:hypothetical protein
MNILFTLCGRAGSKGVKGKNARDFLGCATGVVLYGEHCLVYGEIFGQGDDIKDGVEYR